MTLWKVFGTHDENTLEQFQDVGGRAVKAALMADGHRGYVMPIGGVVGYRGQVSVVGVGFDIACGNCAIRTDLLIQDLCGLTLPEIQAVPYRAATNPKLNRLADHIHTSLSFGMGGENRLDSAPFAHPFFDDERWYLIPNEGRYREDLKEKARRQVGTIGSGNHYVDVFVAEDGYVWVGVHFGSRGFGHTIASNFLAISQGGAWGDRGKEVEVLLDTKATVGADYWALMELVGDYAYLAREWVARWVVEQIDGEETDMVHNHHNFAWVEEHDGEDLVVVRKGATPAWPEQRGFVGGSMGDMSVILEGAAHSNQQEDAMFSTVHGAGRVMGRMAAKGKRHKRTNEVIREGRVSRVEMDKWLEGWGVVLRGGDVDESPQVYRRLPVVLQEQGDTVKVTERLRPLVVCMAGGGR